MPPLLILFNLVPLAGLLALRKGLRKSAGTMITVPLAIALVIGFSAHFLSSGTDNVFRMVPGEWRLIISDQCRAAGLPGSPGLLDWTKGVPAPAREGQG